jgi:hypothetical protein
MGIAAGLWDCSSLSPWADVVVPFSQLFPQPFVVTQNGDSILLDKILGNGFSVLAGSSNP